ncbi:BA14K family protein [Brevundimonas sp. DC300-4]|uniref:BA14K family protein n=1 Tax=unclassified Brevundimonas TaxID=2622653 RepID=UPI003CFA0B22
MKAAALAAALLTASVALPAAAPVAAQNWGYPDQARTWSSYGRYGNDYNGQQDRPGDYRCDAYWDRAREDCDARWRDQRPYRSYSSNPRYSRYGREHDGGGYVYQPYNQGTQYYGAYGRPDQVYPGSGYGGQVQNYYGAGYSNGRDSGRSAYCASRYRSYDPVSGYYRAWSGRLVFCG